MEVGTEISQKIRSAIKAKLLELGSYVDDELPDYIMVMVANKKSRDKMKSDLALFLGANTDTFTEWLHGLLSKLQTISAEQNDTVKSTSSKVKTSKKKHKRDSSGKLKDKKSDIKSSSDNKAKEEISDNEKSDSVNSRNASNAADVAEAKPDSDVENDAENEDVTDVEDVRQLLVTHEQNDDLVQELESAEKYEENTQDLVQVNIVKPQSKSLKRSPSPDIREVQTDIKKRKVPSSVVASVKKDEDDEEYDPFNPAVGSVASVVKVTSRKPSVPISMQANRALLMKAMTEAEKSIAVKRKVGVTRPISREDSPSDLYTPKRRRSGSKIEEVPPLYIPSRKDKGRLLDRSSLSYEDVKYRLSQDDRRELISRSRRQELLESIGIKHNEESATISDGDKVRSREIEPTNSKGSLRDLRITTRIGPSKEFSTRAKEAIKRHLSPPVHKVKGKRVPENNDSKSRVSATSRLGKIVSDKPDASTTKASKEAERNSQHSDKDRWQKDRHAVSKIGKDLVRKQCVAAVLSVKSKNLDRKTPETKTIRRERSRESMKYVETDEYQTSYSERNDCDDKSDEEDLAELLEPDLLDVTDDFSIELQEQLNKETSTETELNNAKGTRFIVTLDGVNVEQFQDTNANFREPVASKLQPSKPLEAVTVPYSSVAPSIASYVKLAPPKIQPFSINLRESDDETEEKDSTKIVNVVQSYSVEENTSTNLVMEKKSMSTLKLAKMSERCRFWPACAAGVECDYHHPTTHCKTFPNCKFGDKCLFIHPNCRFDSKCRRIDCPYTHTSKRKTSQPPVITLPQPNILFAPATRTYAPSVLSGAVNFSTVCRFHPHCQNVSCNFLHPKSCKFGKLCSISSCPFYHPPDTNKLKWQATSRQKSLVKNDA